MDQKVTYKIGNYETEEIIHENYHTLSGYEAILGGVRVET